MYISASGHSGANKHTYQHELTYRVVIRGWISVREGSRGTTYRVAWFVAGRPRGRTFRSPDSAESFRRMLTAAMQDGQPFEVRSGIPLVMAAKSAGRGRHRRCRHASR